MRLGMTLALVVLAWTQIGGAGPRDLPAPASPGILVFEGSGRVPLEEILAFLPGGRILAIGPQEGKSSRGLPWTLASAVTPTLRKVLTMARHDRTVPVIIGLAPGVSLDEICGLLEARGGTISWRETSGVIPRVGFLVPNRHLQAAIEDLEIFDGRVVFIDVQPGARLQNGRSAPLGQGGDFLRTPLFDRGLLGQGQIIGLMDTGIDADSCFFHDPHHG